MPLSSASPISTSSVENIPTHQPGRTLSALDRSRNASPSHATSDNDDSSQALDDRPSDSQEEIQDSFDSNEDPLTNDNSLIPDGSDSPLSSLASRTPTPPSSTSLITVTITREQHDEHVYPGRLPLCKCQHWCHCERYRYFSGGLGDTLRHVDEDGQSIESIQPWRVPNQQHLSNTVLDAEILPESSMRSTYTPAYGHKIKAANVNQEDKTFLLGARPPAPKEPTFHRSDGTQRFSWEEEGYGARAPHRWQGDSWRGALSQDGRSEVPRAAEGHWLAMSDGPPVKVVGGKRKVVGEWDGKVTQVKFEGRVMKRLKVSSGGEREEEAQPGLEDEGMDGEWEGTPVGQSSGSQNGRVMQGDLSFHWDGEAEARARTMAFSETAGAMEEPEKASIKLENDS